MESEATIDLTALLAPISEGAAAGVDLMASRSASYTDIRDKRGAARKAELQLDAAGDGHSVPAEWRTVAELAPGILATESKDLRVTFWLIEALLRVHGFAGLRDGFLLAKGIVDTFWDTFLPLDEGDDPGARLHPLTPLGGPTSTLIQPLYKVPLTDHAGERAYSFHDCERAQAFSQLEPKKQEERLKTADVITLEVFQAAVTDSGPEFYRTCIADLGAALEALDALSETLLAHAGAEAPSLNTVREGMESIRGRVLEVTANMVLNPAPEPARAAAPVVAEIASAATTAAPTRKPDVIGGRDQALQQLLQVAEYFRQSEPQSPIAEILEETVRRARLSFSDLLAELLPDAAARSLVLSNAGIKPPAA